MRGRLGLGHYDVGLMLVRPATMVELNGRHRSKWRITDVLSFPANDNVVPGELLKLTPTGPHHDLGDMIMCPEYIYRQAGHSCLRFRQFTVAALAHSLCHLVGYTHDSEPTAKQVGCGGRITSTLVNPASLSIADDGHGAATD